MLPPRRNGTLAGSKPRYPLPNGTAVAQLNKNETDYLYQEIFARQAYLRHGITIHDGDCLFDVGANIGLFTLIAAAVVGRKGRVVSFEPTATTFERLVDNVRLNRFSNVSCVNVALSDSSGYVSLNQSIDGFDGWNSLAPLTKGHASTDELTAASGERAELIAALAQLSDVQREAVVLAYFGGRTYREVAEELEIPEGTAKTRLRDGLSKLRKVLPTRTNM